MGMAIPDPSDQTYHTAEMVRALIDEERAWPRYETVNGELLVTPAPRGSHQFVVGHVHARIWNYLERWRVGVVLASPADISWGRDDVLVQPDVFVIPMDQALRLHGDGPWTVVRHLALAVEVISPSSVRADRFTKRVLFQRMGVPLYWVIDAARGEAEVWTPERQFPEFERERLTWHPAGADEPLVLELAALFAPP